MPGLGAAVETADSKTASHALRQYLGRTFEIGNQSQFVREHIRCARGKKAQRDGRIHYALHRFIQGAVATGNKDQIYPCRNRPAGNVAGCAWTGSWVQRNVIAGGSENPRCALHALATPCAKLSSHGVVDEDRAISVDRKPAVT